MPRPRASTIYYLLLCGALLVGVGGGVWNDGLYEVLTVAAPVWVVATIAFGGYRLATIGKGTRPCPRCGERVNNGVLDCAHCDFNFRTIGAPVARSGT